LCPRRQLFFLAHECKLRDLTAQFTVYRPTEAREWPQGFPLPYSGFFSSRYYYHHRVSDTPDPMTRWEVFKFIVLGVFISAVLTAVVVLIAVRASNP
jgi:hypothetical protein